LKFDGLIFYVAARGLGRRGLFGVLGLLALFYLAESTPFLLGFTKAFIITDE